MVVVIIRSIVSSNLGNALSVDWTGGAEPPYYMAVQNARLVGLELAYLLKLLIKEFGVNPEELHFIGMGVGAHIAGLVAGILIFPIVKSRHVLRCGNRSFRKSKKGGKGGKK